MGAIGGAELVQWEKAEGLDAAPGGGGFGRAEKILVSVRLRPLSEREIAQGDPADWECINDTTIIFRNSLAERSMAPTAYAFDRVFPSNCATKEVYEHWAKEVALSVVSGINSSIFAYGQTSSGKTYTMAGITEHTVADIYDYIHKHKERAFVLKFSAIEIYNEAVRDLLSADPTPLRLMDDPEKGTIVEKLIEEVLRDWNHLRQLISVCEAQRKIGETSLNETSSRSHQILRLTIESSAREFLGKDSSSTLVASVNFVDLAGSERASQALSAGARLKEGCYINRSLLTLGTVIRKLSKGRNAHIPYRESKLTRILQPSLGGNARTAIICTMCPARSHIEQSRNTLLFASCAKEVVTNAQVNVVMSDKALVKHLQRELARLESELRFPLPHSGIGALLKEKDAHIEKMEKELKELKKQRDLAQSRLQDLLQVVGDNCSSRQGEASGRTCTSFSPHMCEDEQSTTTSAEVSVRKANFELAKSSSFQNEHTPQVSFKERQNNITPPGYSTSNNSFSGVHSYHSRDDTTETSHEDSEDVCKEVRCIEIIETERSEGSNFLQARGGRSLSDVNIGSSRYGNRDPIPQANLRCLTTDPITLEQHLKNVKRNLVNLVRENHEGSNPWFSKRDMMSSRGFELGRSRSCRSTFMSSSTWLKETSQTGCTPPCTSLQDFPGRPDRFRMRGLALNYDASSDALSKEGSLVSELGASVSAIKTQNSTAASEDFPGITDFVVELKDIAQNIAGEETVKSTGLDPILDALQSPSRWPMEFEKKQQQIIELWHACSISLVHRTYFFLLFKGDPADSIYMEVELKRLSFLKNTCPGGNSDRNLFGGLSSNLVMSMKKLQREREKLCRQLQRRLSREERESMYTKWGIALDSKRRRMQLVRRLWTRTKDLEHVRESASLVAKLIGLLEPGQALKEMFGLSFAPQQALQRSHRSWRYSISSVS